jgi:hypothetical protein
MIEEQMRRMWVTRPFGKPLKIWVDDSYIYSRWYKVQREVCGLSVMVKLDFLFHKCGCGIQKRILEG